MAGGRRRSSPEPRTPDGPLPGGTLGRPLASPPVWPTRDPIAEQGGANLYALCLNNPIRRVDRDGSASGSYILDYSQVPLYGEQARNRGRNAGDTVDGYKLRYAPEKPDKCPCLKEDIQLVQAIKHDSSFVPKQDAHFDANDPLERDNRETPGGTLPPIYGESYGYPEGQLVILDSPWSSWPKAPTYTIEVCAICRTSPKKDPNSPEQILGCITFKWSGYKTLDKRGPFAAEEPGALWKAAFTKWNTDSGQ